jgi:histone H3/H4
MPNFDIEEIETEMEEIIIAGEKGEIVTAVPKSARRRRRRSTKLERRIRHLQTTGKSMVPKKTFSHLTTMMLRNVQPRPGFRLAKDARFMLQADTEYYVSMMFAKANLIARRRGGVTVSDEDLRVAEEISSPEFAPEGI